MNELVMYALADGVATLTLANGKVNAFSPDLIASFNRALDQAEQAGAVVIVTGQPGILSGGYDLKVMQSSPQAALEVAEKIRRRVMHTPQAVNATEHVDSSVSVGVACFAPGKTCSFEKLYAQADQALYEAKRLGRNRVVQSDGG